MNTRDKPLAPEQDRASSYGPWKKLAWFVLYFFLGVGLFVFLKQSSLIETLQNSRELQSTLAGLKGIAPLAIIGLMVTAILVSPIPSAPIALAAGALYGHTWGTLIVIIGAELGAILAFTIARKLGYDAVKKMIKGEYSLKAWDSQTTLMSVVFVSRLLPFISFDVVSYIAGLTNLAFWRFAIATLAGIAPMSFLLAHFGSELVATELKTMSIAVVAIGILTGASYIYAVIKTTRS